MYKGIVTLTLMPLLEMKLGPTPSRTPNQGCQHQPFPNCLKRGQAQEQYLYCYGAVVLLQTIPVLVSSRLRFQVIHASHLHLVSVSYGFHRHVTDTLGCYNYFTGSMLRGDCRRVEPDGVKNTPIQVEPQGVGQD